MVLLGCASTAVAEEPAERRPDGTSISERDHAPAFVPDQRAAAACRYAEDRKAWACDPNILKHFNVRTHEVIVSPPELAVAATLIGGVVDGERCIAALAVEVNHRTRPIGIDWSKVSISRNRIAIQAVPGFARSLSANLAQRPSTAQAGISIRETIHPITAECLLGRDVAATGDEMTLHLPVTLDGTDHLVQVTWSRAWTSTTEADAFRLLSSPPSTPPAVPKVDPRWDYTGTAIGGGIGAVAGTLAAVTLGFIIAELPLAESSKVAGTIVYGSFIVGLLTAGGGFAGMLLFDDPYIRQLRSWREWQDEDDKRKAFVRRRVELGLSE